jgi:hypothetical protein
LLDPLGDEVWYGRGTGFGEWKVEREEVVAHEVEEQEDDGSRCDPVGKESSAMATPARVLGSVFGLGHILVRRDVGEREDRRFLDVQSGLGRGTGSDAHDAA